MDPSSSPVNKTDEMGEDFTSDSKTLDTFPSEDKMDDSDSSDSEPESPVNKSEDASDPAFSSPVKSNKMETLIRTISIKEILSSGEQYHDMVLRCNGESAGIPVHKLVLAAASPLLSRCLSGSEDYFEVVFPETVPSQLFHFVQYIYTGATDALDQLERQKLTELLERLCVGEDFDRDDPKFSLHKPSNSLKVKLEVDYDSTEENENEPDPEPEINYAAAEQFLWQNETFKEEKRKKKRKVKNPVKNREWSGDEADYFGDKGDDDEDFHMGFRTDSVKVKEEVNGVESKPKKPKIEGNWSCKVCPKKFTKEQKYLDHQSVHTGEGLKCKFCPKLFERPGLRRVHEQLHTKPFKCDSCESSFGRKSNLIGHQRIHRGERPYICDLCGKGFPIQSSLLTHKKQSHPDVPKPWFCEFCELRFVSKSQLEIHKRSHTGEKPWICDSCGRGFTTKQNMLDHTRLHTDNMDYQCNVCSQRFKWKQSLERHLMDHTGVRPYPCVQCKLTFKTSNSLKKHGLSVHSDIKHFSCQYCGSRFSTSSGVLRHQKKQRCAAIKTGAVEMKDADDKRLGTGTLPYFNRHLDEITTKTVKTEPQSNFGSLPLFLQEAAHNFQQNNQRPPENSLGIHGLHQAILEKSGQGLHQALIEQRGQMEQRGPLALDRQSVSQPLALHRPPPLHQQRNPDRPQSPEHYGRQSPDPHSGPPSVERMTPNHMTDRTQQMQAMAGNFRNTHHHLAARPQSPEQYGRRSPENGPPSVDNRMDRMTPTATHVSMIDDRGQHMQNHPLAMTVPRPGMASQVHNYYGKGWATPSNLEKEVVNSIQP